MSNTWLQKLLPDVEMKGEPYAHTVLHKLSEMRTYFTKKSVNRAFSSVKKKNISQADQENGETKDFD